jgi:hypothetical protein
MTDKELYKQAKKRVEAKRSVWIHAAVYVLVNAFLVIIYFVTGGNSGGTVTDTATITIGNTIITGTNGGGAVVEYFWPIWPMLGWGLGLAIHAAVVFSSLKNFDSEVEKEFIKLKATSGEKFSETNFTEHASREN